ncbi:MAG: hypothetical protein IMW91_00540 [Firmicutes bacterium]|nr:hypothetical protein [Bacillota bacterium]
MTGPLEARSVEPTGASPRGTLLLLHGYGSNRDDLLGLAPHLSFMRLVAANGPIDLDPPSPEKPLRMKSYAWFDFEGEKLRPIVDSVATSVNAVLDLAYSLKERFPGPFFLGGFSQGGLMTYACGLKEPRLFNGLIVMSGWWPPADPDWPAAEDALQGLPILAVHGTHDDRVPFALGQAAAEEAKKLGADVTFLSFSMMHEVTAESIAAVAGWLDEHCPPKST